MEEVWVDIDGYDKYQVSNMGNVRNKNTMYILKQYDNGNGYKIISLRNNERKLKYLYIHRLVALAFCERMEGKDCVDHINCIRDDNRSSNLRWCTTKENNNFPQTRLNMSKSLKIAMNRKGVKEKLAKAMEGVYKDAEVKKKMSKASIFNHKNGIYDHLKKEVLMIDDNGNTIKEYCSVSSVLEDGYDPSFVSKVCRGKKDMAYGYMWKFK